MKNLEIRIGLPVVEQLNNFKNLQKNVNYCISVELISGLDERNIYFILGNNILDELVEQSNIELLAIFNFIHENKIKGLKFYKIHFMYGTYVFLANLIQCSNLQYLTFNGIPSETNFKAIIMPAIFRSKLKSFNWIDSNVNNYEIEYLYDNIQNNYYLQSIIITKLSLMMKKINKYCLRNESIAFNRFHKTILLLLINRFGTLKFIPVDVFRIIAKKYYFDFISDAKFHNIL